MVNGMTTHKIVNRKLTESETPNEESNIIVMRHAHGITLNDVTETLLDGDGNDMVFDNLQKAREFLLNNGFEEDDLIFLYFVEVDEAA